jgi:hypothetical protein
VKLTPVALGARGAAAIAGAPHQPLGARTFGFDGKHLRREFLTFPL